MKLKKLKINSLYHIKDLEFDFTYPKEHEKAGEPLEKICFIGQSATGKTNLLKLILNNISYILRAELVNGNEIWHQRDYLKNSSFILSYENEDVTVDENGISYRNNNYSNDRKTNGGSITNLLYNLKNSNKILYFDNNYISNENIKYFNTKPLDILFEPKNLSYDDLDEFIFDDNISDLYIIKLLKSFLDYRQKFDSKARELLLNGFIQDINKLNHEFQKWQKENPNPIDNFSERFDLLLNKLNLEIDRINVDYPIPFKNKSTDEIIPVDKLSTGTKGLLLYMLPLYLIETSKSIILIDEPERSLYPDIQMELMDFFKEVSPKSQFIVATHSPFIAASFEPEERFILYFDEDGKVNVKNGVSPIGDDPNDILKSDFQLEYLMNKDGRNAYEKYKKLKKALAEETDKQKKDKILDELMEIGTAYKF